MSILSTALRRPKPVVTLSCGDRHDGRLGELEISRGTEWRTRAFEGGLENSREDSSIRKRGQRMRKRTQGLALTKTEELNRDKLSLHEACALAFLAPILFTRLITIYLTFNYGTYHFKDKRDRQRYQITKCFNCQMGLQCDRRGRGLIR
jgi:hypothetical protein